ncbi:MAG: Malto-oligosyltrehalose synthase, partial [uncultured Chloroflexia bacterium]
CCRTISTGTLVRSAYYSRSFLRHCGCLPKASSPPASATGRWGEHDGS